MFCAGTSPGPPTATPGGRAFVKLPVTYTVLPTTAWLHTTPLICQVGRASAPTVSTGGGGGVSAAAAGATRGGADAPATTTAARAARAEATGRTDSHDASAGEGAGVRRTTTRDEDATQNGSEGEDEGGEGHRGREQAEGHGEQPDPDGDVEAPDEQDRALVPAGDREAGEGLHGGRRGGERGPPDDGDDLDVDRAPQDDGGEDGGEEGDPGTHEDGGGRHRDAGPAGPAPKVGEGELPVAGVGAEQVGPQALHDEQGRGTEDAGTLDLTERHGARGAEHDEPAGGETQRA